MNLTVSFPVHIQRGKTGMLSLFSLDHLFFLSGIEDFKCMLVKCGIFSHNRKAMLKGVFRIGCQSNNGIFK